MKETKIRWTGATWNPVRATPGFWYCQKLSPGCDHCYASTLNQRLAHGPAYPDPGMPMTSDLRLDAKALRLPLTWREGRRVFVCSMTDMFGDWVSPDWHRDMVDVMLRATQHAYQILTKRPKNMAAAMPGLWPRDAGRARCWAGASIESDSYVWRANYVRDLKAEGFTTFISAEPLLAPLPHLDLTGIDWLIVGGESGPGYRPMDHAWARELRDMAAESGTAFYFKQDSGHRTEERPWLVEEDGSHTVIEEYPDEAATWRADGRGRALATA